jgi:RecA-family ATPase
MAGGKLWLADPHAEGRSSMTAPQSPAERRKQLLSAGYVPTPVRGKRPFLDEWQKKTETNRDEIDLWSKLYPDAKGTGLLTQLTPALDLDILDQDAAEACEALARERFEERGFILVRVGLPPKRAILFRTNKPFQKITANLIAANVDPKLQNQKVEMLADRQQLAAFGIPPDTGRAYRWFGGEPGEIKRDDLPYIHEAEARQLIEDVSDLLVRDHGYQRAKGRPKKERTTNGGDDTAGPVDWGYLVENIRAGRALHDSLRDLAGKLVRSGMGSGAAINFLRGLMDETAEADRDQRWKDRRAEIVRLVESAEAPEAAGLANIAFIDITRDPIPPRYWVVPQRVPGRNVTLISGEGAVGKSLLLLQLSTAIVLGRDWIGTVPVSGPVIYLNCEDDDDEICRRLEAVCTYYGVTRADIAGQLHVLSFAGRDAILAYADRSDRVHPTPLFEQLKKEALRIRPKLIVIDTVADVFSGNENDRAQTRQFITLQRGLAIEIDGAIILASHPSLTGIASGSGLSGTTAWHNSVRARMYMKSAADDSDDDLRLLQVKKNNYGKVSENIVLRWRDGVYVPEPREGTLEQVAADAQVDNLFLDLLRRFASQKRNVSPSRSPTYAPSVFADQKEAKQAKVKTKAFAEAMERLLAAKKIEIIKEGPPSRQRERIAEAGSDDDPRIRIIGDAPDGATCIHCHTDSDEPVMKIKDARIVGGKTETLHMSCAFAWFRLVLS